MQPALPYKPLSYFLVCKQTRWRTLFCSLPVEEALKTSPWPGLPLQIETTYLHNRTQHANIQHDFAINESEKGLEMIFDLIEWHNWLDYTKFFFSLKNPQMLRRKQTNQTDWARSCAFFCVCFYSLLVHTWICWQLCFRHAWVCERFKCFYVGAWLEVSVYAYE